MRLDTRKSDALQDANKVFSKDRVCVFKVSALENVVQRISSVLQALVQLLEDCLFDVWFELRTSVTNVCIHVHNEVVVAD